MALPEVIEVVPPTPCGPVRVTIPGSKSITNRALVLAALSDGRTTLRGALWSEDTAIMVGCLHTLGFEIAVEADAGEDANRTITVAGLGGRLPDLGGSDEPLDLFVGNAGTVARFLLPLLCLGAGSYRVKGTPRMNERPQGALFNSLRELGYRVQAAGDTLPAVITGGTSRSQPGVCTVSIAESSQFASALLLAAGVGGWQVQISGENAEESPYVAMTTKLIAAFPRGGGEFVIEPDCSSASYFWAAGALLPDTRLRVSHWPSSGWQIDARFVDFCGRFPKGAEGLVVSRRDDLADSIMTAIVLAPLLDCPTNFTDLGRLRVQESERVAALRTELTKCGAKVVEVGDTLEVFPATLHGADIETYNDHRIAMCFAVLGLRVPGIRIHQPMCVIKTFPNFFAKIAAPAPAGLGARILNAATRQVLQGRELLAE